MAGFSADSVAPAQPMGVDPGEELEILFWLQDDLIFDDVLDDLATGALRIGIHARGFASGGGESFVNEIPIDPAMVPLPGAVLLGMLGLGVAGVKLRRCAR